MFALNPKLMPTGYIRSSLFSAYASFTAFMMLVHTVLKELKDFIPRRVRSYIYSKFEYYFFGPTSNQLTLVINKHSGMTLNEVYEKVEVYLGAKISPSDKRLVLSKTKKQKTVSLAIEKRSQVVIDTFDGVELQWQYRYREKNKQNNEVEYEWWFDLTFNEKYKAKVIDSYIPYVFAQADSIQQGQRVLKLYAFNNTYSGTTTSGSIDLVHPATFDTVAMDPELKKMIIEDLDSNADLRKVLMATTNRSILIIEDIDCSVHIERESSQSTQSSAYSSNKLTLSGLLNFIDGLWSCCGDERIIVFTTNHKERLDPALLRPGRMDVHIHLSYCTPSAFRTLASNYLGIQSNPHHLCEEIESLIGSTEVTSAAVAGELMKSNDADVVLEGLLKFLKEKKAVDEKNKLEKAKTAELEGTNKQEKQGWDEVVTKN
ncbi:hypothetical protein ACLB2K_003439 [Fragaria x ananassa]